MSLFNKRSSNSSNSRSILLLLFNHLVESNAPLNKYISTFHPSSSCSPKLAPCITYIVHLVPKFVRWSKVWMTSQQLQVINNTCNVWWPIEKFWKPPKVASITLVMYDALMNFGKHLQVSRGPRPRRRLVAFQRTCLKKSKTFRVATHATPCWLEHAGPILCSEQWAGLAGDSRCRWLACTDWDAPIGWARLA